MEEVGPFDWASFGPALEERLTPAQSHVDTIYLPKEPSQWESGGLPGSGRRKKWARSRKLHLTATYTPKEATAAARSLEELATVACPLVEVVILSFPPVECPPKDLLDIEPLTVI